MSEANIDKIILDVPAMYADHHVTEVRRLLLNIPGVRQVYASSAFKVVEAAFEGGDDTAAEIRHALSEAGYLDELVFPSENSAAGQAEPVFFRHTTAYEQTRGEVSFGQNVGYLGRPLWTCPGMGVIKKMEE